MKKIFLLASLILSISIYGQNKKEQIKRLTNVVDSLNQVISSKNLEIDKNKNQLSDTEIKINELSSLLASYQDSLKVLKDLYQQLIDETKGIQQKEFEKKIGAYIKSFYQSLELSDKENQNAEENATPFPKKEFKKFLSTCKSYSKKRIKELTGDYHPRYNIELLEISNILILDTIIVVETKVEYGIYELGVFINIEEIQLGFNKEKMEILGWYDINPIKFIKGNFGDSEPKELYTILGSNFK